MRRRLSPAALRRDERGATIVEFALILPVLAVLLLGTLDLGYRAYVAAVVQGSLHEAARMGTVGGVSTATIETHIRDRLRSFSRNATIEVETKSYADFSGVGIPETITSDTTPLGSYNTGDCFQDYNGNGSYDTNRGRTGMGGSEDVVRLEVRMTYPHIVPVPVGRLLEWNNNVTVVQNTVLRNQPFAARNTAAPIVC